LPCRRRARRPNAREIEGAVEIDLRTEIPAPCASNSTEKRIPKPPLASNSTPGRKYRPTARRDRRRDDSGDRFSLEIDASIENPGRSRVDVDARLDDGFAGESSTTRHHTSTCSTRELDAASDRRRAPIADLDADRDRRRDGELACATTAIRPECDREHRAGSSSSDVMRCYGWTTDAT
jgi:hypothetical protein